MKTLRGSLAAATVGLMLLFSALPVAAATDHCAGHDGNPEKVEASSGSVTRSDVLFEWDGDPGSLTVTNNNDVETATFEACLKGGTGFNGDDKAQTVTGTLAPGEDVTFDFGTEISYFLFVSVNLTSPTPTPTPTPTPAVPTPTPTPTDNVDTGGGNEPPTTRSTVPPTDTVSENTEIVVDPMRNPLLFVGIFLLALAAAGMFIEARKGRKR